MICRKKVIIIFVCLVSGSVLAEPQPEVKALNLHDLLKEAIEHSPLISKAKHEKQFAELEEVKNKSLYWPRLRLESTHGQRNQNPKPYLIPETSASSLILSQNLWREGIDAKKIALAKTLKRKAEIHYFQQRDELCLKVTQEYYRYSQLVKSLEIQKNQQKLIKKQFDLISDEYLHGLRSRRDFLRFKSQAQRAELDLQRQITLVERSRLNLLAISGLPEEMAKVQFRPEDSSPSLLDLFKNPASIDKTYEGQVINLTKDANEITQDIAVQQIDPSINLDFNTALNSSSYWNTGLSFDSQQTQSWSALLVLNWTFWDGGEQRSKKSQAIITNEIQKADLSQKKIELTQDILKLQTQFRQLRENFKTSEELLILEQNNFLFIEGEYRQSKATYLDFINGVKDLAEAQNRHWGNLFDLKQGIILYHYYKGSLFQFLLTDYTDAEDQDSEDI
ncbi:MAG: hypothetical protein RJB66_1285 [Pseudomonadota bacterium]|jgi:outer membrane protein TolC